MKSLLAWLRLNGLRRSSKQLGIYRHPAVTKIEMELQCQYMRATTGESSNVN